MAKHELCPRCKEYGECLLIKNGNKIAEKVPSLEKHTLMFPGINNVTVEAYDAYCDLERLREIAKKEGCLNEFDPDFPGKDRIKDANMTSRIKTQPRKA